MQPTPDAYAAAFRRALAEFEEIAGPLSRPAFNWRPAPEKWSVGQCIDHLNRMSERYLPELEATVSAGGPGGQPPFHYGPLGRLFIRGTSPEVLLKVRTMDAMAPRAGDLDPAEVLATLRAHTARFLDVIARARGLDLSKIRMRSPFLPRVPFLTFPVGALLEGSAGHELRHLDQARRVTEAPGFPRG